MIKKIQLLIALCTLLFISCNKYDEGSISLTSKKNRLVGEWELESIDGGSNVINIQTGLTQIHSWQCQETYQVYERHITQSDVSWEFEKDQDLKVYYFNLVRNLNYGQSYTDANTCEPLYITTDSLQVVEVARWELSKSKEDIKIYSGNNKIEYEIIELSTDKLKLKSDLNVVYLFSKKN